MGDSSIKKTMNWVIGITSIALVLLVLLIIFGNLSGNTGITTTQTTSYVNESGFVNDTGYTPTGVTAVQNYLSYTIQEVWANASTTAVLIPSTNYTQTGNVIYNGTTLDFGDFGYDDASITYIVTSRSEEYNTAESTITNMTSGLGRVSSQFTTIMLFVGIGLLLFILLAVLVWVIKKMSSVGGSQSNLA